MNLKRNSSNLYGAVHNPIAFLQLQSLARACNHSLNNYGFQFRTSVSSFVHMHRQVQIIQLSCLSVNFANDSNTAITSGNLQLTSLRLANRSAVQFLCMRFINYMNVAS